MEFIQAIPTEHCLQDLKLLSVCLILQRFSEVKVDGSKLTSDGSMATGGLLRDYKGDWLTDHLLILGLVTFLI